jgi:capsule polysaccharide export protein KpsE/RkpR
MKAMQQYSFASGVKGMTNMAKQSVKMRVDVSEILQMADKFYQPEAAIEAAANLQLLGGDIAEAFGDPFQVMYEARNKPEELAKRVGKMTENMVSFNEETGEFDMPAEARMQLQAVSKELGIGMDSLTEMTRQASKIKSIRMDVSGNILDEDMRDGIA